LYVDDAAHAAVLACDMVEKQSGVYNIGGIFETMTNLFDYVKSLLPDADMQLLQEDFTGPKYEYDDSLTVSELGFVPKFSLKEGIKNTINDTRKFYNLPQIG
jgi:nucleoside-diphosphate-sugar epimerase